MATFKSVDEATSAVTSTAKDELGYLEKKSNSKLDSKTANAGYNNFTKYWRDINNWKLLSNGTGWAGGSQWYWCAAFVCWIFVTVFGKDLAKKLLLHAPFISCQTMATKAKAVKRLYTTPQVGDVILFFNGARFYHTGIVYKVTPTLIRTYEGNTNSSSGVIPNGGAVCEKSYTIASCKAKGHKFFRPDYSLVVEEKSDTTPTTSSKSTEKKYVTVNTSSSNLMCRAEASSKGAAKGKFAKGTKLDLKKKTNSSWWKVKGKDLVTGKSITGFCSAKYLKEI